MTLSQRLTLAASAVLLATLLAVGLLLNQQVLNQVSEEEEKRFFRDLDAAIQLAAGMDAAAPAAAAERLAALLGYQVTLTDPSGRVIADTRVAPGDAILLENHRDRPEFVAARESLSRLVERQSSTTGLLTLYLATPATLGDRPILLRLARQVHPIRDLRGTILAILLGSAVGGILLLWALFRVQGARTVGVSEHLATQLSRMSEGDFPEFPLPQRFPPEFVPLVTQMARLGEEMEGRLSELSRERDEMQTLIDSIAEGVVALTADARVLRINRAAADLLSTGPTVAFAPIGTLIRHPELRDHLEESVLVPLPPKEVILGERSLLVSARHLEEGGSVVTFLDVTELRRMEKIRRDFVANASHELKTPLTSMRGFAETLLEGDPPPELRTEFLNSIRINTVRLQNLVDDLLDLSRLESGAWTIQEEEVVVSEVAQQVWDELRSQHQDRKIRFQIEGFGIALADGQALYQILLNLFANALRYTPDGGSISTRIESTGPELEVAVRDSGTGIPSASLPRIFERFYRVDPGRDRGAGGTGLGLAIVRHLIQMMGGEVAAESELGRGTTIRFTLPRVE